MHVTIVLVQCANREVRVGHALSYSFYKGMMPKESIVNTNYDTILVQQLANQHGRSS